MWLTKSKRSPDCVVGSPRVLEDVVDTDPAKGVTPPRDVELPVRLLSEGVDVSRTGRISANVAMVMTLLP